LEGAICIDVFRAARCIQSNHAAVQPWPREGGCWGVCCVAAPGTRAGRLNLQASWEPQLLGVAGRQRSARLPHRGQARDSGIACNQELHYWGAGAAARALPQGPHAQPHPCPAGKRPHPRPHPWRAGGPARRHSPPRRARPPCCCCRSPSTLPSPLRRCPLPSLRRRRPFARASRPPDGRQTKRDQQRRRCESWPEAGCDGVWG
jgi:hypothetical protein